METHAAQNVKLVLMHAGQYPLTGGGTANFVVGLKDCLREEGVINANNVADNWRVSKRREWCNEDFKNSFPPTLLPIFKQMQTITANRAGTAITNDDFFALHAEKEVHGAITYSAESEATLFQLDWYKSLSHRIKKASGRVPSWYGRSIATDIDVIDKTAGFYCVTTPDGDASYSQTEDPMGISPFGCI